MISIAFDTSMIDGLLNIDSRNNNLMACAFRELLRQIEDYGYRVVIPRPVVDECLQADPNFLSTSGIDQDPVFKIAEFDELASRTVQRISKKLLENSILLGQPSITSPGRIKDIQIIAIAYVNNVQTIYADDRHFKSIIRRVNLRIKTKNKEDLLTKYRSRN